MPRTIPSRPAPPLPPHLADLADGLPPMLDRAEACELLHISSTTLWRLERSGVLRASRVGRRVLYARGELLALLAGRVAG